MPSLIGLGQEPVNHVTIIGTRWVEVCAISGEGRGATERSPLRADARRNRELLLAAAIDVFVEQGVDAPLEEVARRAGVGIATLYRRFPDRQALMRGVALLVLQQVTREARAALASGPDGFRALARYLHRALDLRIAAVMPILDGRLDMRADEELRRARDELAPLFDALVDRARDQGLRADVGPGDIGLMVIRLARPLPGSFSREFDAAAAHRQLDIMLDGLRTGAARQSPAGMTVEQVRRARGRRGDD
jgi:AcrR family transcriptional regulator